MSRKPVKLWASRDTFYRYQDAVGSGGIEALFEPSRRKPNIKNRVRRVDRSCRCGACAGLSRSWPDSHPLANFKLRLKALEVKVAEKGIILTDAQVAALEQKKYDDESCGEIEIAHPGYPGSQDTFYVGRLTGVSRVYPPTFVDTCSQIVFAKRNTKTR